MTLVPHAITVSRISAAPPVAIYAAWTEPDLMRRCDAGSPPSLTPTCASVRHRTELHEDDRSVNGSTGEYLTLEPYSRIRSLTFREIEPGRTEITITNSWTGPAFEPVYYDELRSGWEEWIDRLEKMV